MDLMDTDNMQIYFNRLAEEYPINENTMLAYLDIGHSEKAHAIYDALHSGDNIDKKTKQEPTLLQNYPNPFNPETDIQLVLGEETPVILKIYNIHGRLVKTLVEKKLPAGAHKVHWNGRDDYGRQVPTGVYFLRLRAGEMVQTRKMVLIK